MTRTRLVISVAKQQLNGCRRPPLFFVFFLQARSGRIYDAVLTVAKAIEQILAQNKSLTQPPVANGLCRSNKNQVEPWIDGKMLLNEMKRVSEVFLVTIYSFTFEEKCCTFACRVALHHL